MAEVTISQKNWDTIIDYAHAAYHLWKTEIGGMAIVYKDKDGDYVVDEPVILKQEISGGNCVLDKDELALYYSRTAMKMKKKNFSSVLLMNLKSQQGSQHTNGKQKEFQGRGCTSSSP